MGTVLHKKMGNVHYGLALAFVVGSGIGVTGGGQINRALFNFNPVLSDFVISEIYAVLLGFLGIFALGDFIKTRKGASKDSGDVHGAPVGMTALGVKLQSICQLRKFRDLTFCSNWDQQLQQKVYLIRSGSQGKANLENHKRLKLRFSEGVEKIWEISIFKEQSCRL